MEHIIGGLAWLGLKISSDARIEDWKLKELSVCGGVGGAQNSDLSLALPPFIYFQYNLLGTCRVPDPGLGTGVTEMRKMLPLSSGLWAQAVRLLRRCRFRRGRASCANLNSVLKFCPGEEGTAWSL